MKPKHLPIIFTPEEIQALHTGAMKRFRRPIATLEQDWDCNVLHFDSLAESNGKLNAFFALPENQKGEKNLLGATSPFGKAGDKLWVKEAFTVHPASGASAGDVLIGANMTIRYKAGGELTLKSTIFKEKGVTVELGTDAAGYPQGLFGQWQSAVSMPEWASRTSLKIESIHVQRLQDITEEEARAEGYKVLELVKYDRDYNDERRKLSPLEHYAHRWDEQVANKNYPWAKNPYVWVIEFTLAESLGK